MNVNAIQESQYKGCSHINEYDPKVLHAEDFDFYYYIYFTGNGKEYGIICSECNEAESVQLIENNELSEFYDLNDKGMSFSGIKGVPGIISEPVNISYDIKLLEIEHGKLLDMTFKGDLLFILEYSDELSIITYNLQNHTIENRQSITCSNLDYSEAISIYASDSGRYLVIVNTKGRYGYVVELDTGEIILDLDRQDYHNNHCKFSIAFTTKDQEDILIHSTDWNRLDATNLDTRIILTEREDTERDDYFNSYLTISPDNTYIANNGWVWHPVGMIKIIRLDKWLTQNPFEADISDNYMLQVEYLWDRPQCWINENQLAVYGFCNSDLHIVDGVLIMDIITDNILDWFPGPAGNLIFDKYIYSIDRENGLSIWKLNGIRIHNNINSKPSLYLGNQKFIEHNKDKKIINLVTLLFGD